MEDLGRTFHGFPRAPSEGAGRRPQPQTPVAAGSPPGLCGQSNAPGVPQPLPALRVLRGPRSSFLALGSQSGLPASARYPSRTGRTGGGRCGLCGGAPGPASVVRPPWAGEPLPLPLPLLPAGGDRTKSRDVAERAGEARGERPAAAGGVWGSLRVPARLQGSATVAALPAGRCGATCGGRGKVHVVLSFRDLRG